jgi:hypothetical protein
MRNAYIISFEKFEGKRTFRRWKKYRKGPRNGFISLTMRSLRGRL